MAGDLKPSKSAILTALLILIVFATVYRLSFNKMVMALLLVFAYLTGFLSIFLGITLSFLTYIASFPIISTIHAYIAFILAKIHYIIFRIFLDKFLRRMNWFVQLELKVKNSFVVKRITRATTDFFRGLSRGKPRKVKFFEVIECTSCRKDVPVDGNFCPYCGEELVMSHGYRKTSFQSRFEDFYSHIRDLVGLEYLKNLSRYPGHRHFGENKGRLRHAYNVAWLCYLMSSKLNVDSRLLTRAGLLHDIGYESNASGALGQILSHAKRGADMVREMGEDERIGEMVYQHMFPLGMVPLSRESWVLWLADKAASTLEFLRLESLFRGDEVWRRVKQRMNSA